METLNAKSLNDGDDVDTDNNKPKDFPTTNGQLITDKTENLKSALSTTTKEAEKHELAETTTKGDTKDNRSISNLLRNDATHDASAVVQNGNCDDHEAHQLHQQQQQRQQLLILNSLSEKSPCSKNGPMIETVNDGLTNIAIEEKVNCKSSDVDASLSEKESLCQKECGDDSKSQQQISVVRLSQNGDIADSQQPDDPWRPQQQHQCESESQPNQPSLCPSTLGDATSAPLPPQPPSQQQHQQQQPPQPWCSAASLSTTLVSDGISYVRYENESQMPDIMRLITKDLSEPYSIYTYRYFIHNWPKLCFLAMDEDKCVGAIVCKLDIHKKMANRGYIAMLAVDNNYRRRKIGSTLVRKAIRAMILDEASSCDEVVLETEITNTSALRLYENLGFVRDKRLFRYYLNGVDALRLKLWLR